MGELNILKNVMLQKQLSSYWNGPPWCDLRSFLSSTVFNYNLRLVQTKQQPKTKVKTKKNGEWNIAHKTLASHIFTRSDDGMGLFSCRAAISPQVTYFRENTHVKWNNKREKERKNTNIAHYEKRCESNPHIYATHTYTHEHTPAIWNWNREKQAPTLGGLIARRKW